MSVLGDFTFAPYFGCTATCAAWVDPTKTGSVAAGIPLCSAAGSPDSTGSSSYHRPQLPSVCWARTDTSTEERSSPRTAIRLKESACWMSWTVAGVLGPGRPTSEVKTSCVAAFCKDCEVIAVSSACSDLM
ncbi:Uncharacterised protein [Mycobacteroides abscessus subsp. abscessus]|nr:Uncharacterised protein [Mycobacteroides abscessus subsp. abscessus]